MFTSEPSLAQRIERMIAETPIIDTHTNLRADQLAVPDLAALLAEPGVRTELRSVGMPRADFNPALPVDERVRRTIPYLRRMRNTASAWCLYRIFRDLYDFGEPDLTESNYVELLDRVAATGRDPAWASSLLREQSNFRAFATNAANQGSDPAQIPANLFHWLDVTSLVAPALGEESAPDAADASPTDPNYYDALCALLGDRPNRTERLATLIGDWLGRTVTGSVRFTHARLPIDRGFSDPDEAHAQFVLTQYADDWDPADIDTEALAHYVTWQIFAWHHENRKPLQLAFGLEPPRGGHRRLPRFREDWSSDLAQALSRFKKARFELLTASDLLSQEVAELARQYPNAYASGYWQHTFVPPSIERTFGLRIQTAPMTKVVGFFSEASSVEWAYGKLQVAKKAMAAALARQVDAGYFEEHDLPPILHQVLHDTPRDLYGLLTSS